MEMEMENTIQNCDAEQYAKYEKIKNDFLEFIECAKRCIEPNNILLFNIIMNALEIALVRMERDEQINNEIITAENIDGVLTTSIINEREEKTCNSSQTQNGKTYYNTSNLSEETKKEIDDIINDIINE